MKVRDMKAGRDLDALVAKEVMGCTTIYTDRHFLGETIFCCGCENAKHGEAYSRERFATHDHRWIERYSEFIDAAWKVIDHLGLYWDLSGSKENNEYCMMFYEPADAHTAYAETPALSICLAALILKIGEGK